MLIVIEGVDRTGKSTLARRIAQLTDGQVIHAGPPTHGSIEEYETSIDWYDPRRADNLVLDRWHIGEYVWPTIFGRKTDFSLPVQRHVEMFMRSRGAVYIYTDLNREKIARELVENSEPLQPTRLAEACGLFDLARSSQEHPDCFYWNYETSTDEDLEEILGAAHDRQYEAARVWEYTGPNFIGSLFPIALLVGDRQGPKKETRNEPKQVPFAPYPATSGHYLCAALDCWRDVAVVNATDRDSSHEYDLSGIWDALLYPRAVALGNFASDALYRHNIRHRLVPHPQYWKRFRHGELEIYTRLLSGEETSWAGQTR